MPLPIPDILFNASEVLKEAKRVIEQPSDKPDLSDLKAALKKIHPDDIAAVMNEVGKVYAGLHNIQVQQIGARASMPTNTFDVALQIDFGLGQRTLVIPLQLQAAEALVENLTAELALLKPNRIINHL